MKKECQKRSKKAINDNKWALEEQGNLNQKKVKILLIQKMQDQIPFQLELMMI